MRSKHCTSCSSRLLSLLLQRLSELLLCISNATWLIIFAALSEMYLSVFAHFLAPFTTNQTTSLQGEHTPNSCKCSCVKKKKKGLKQAKTGNFVHVPVIKQIV